MKSEKKALRNSLTEALPKEKYPWDLVSSASITQPTERQAKFTDRKKKNALSWEAKVLICSLLH